MSAVWTSKRVGIGAKGKIIQAEIVGLRANAANGRQRHRNKRIPVDIASANHRLGQTDTAVLGRLRVNEPPEAMDILLEMPEHEIGAITPEIALLREILGRRKNVLGVEPGVDQRPPCILSVFILVAEQKLANRD